MHQLHSEVDIDGNEKSEEEKAKARALDKYIKERRELIDKYFDSQEYDGFTEDYIRYKNYIDKYNASHKYDSLEKKLADDVQYREAYNWIKNNGRVAFGKEESVKLRQHFKTLTGRVNVIRNKTMAQLKNIDGVMFCVYLILYSFVRILVEHFRIDSILYLGKIPLPSVVSILIIVVAGILLLFIYRKYKKS